MVPFPVRPEKQIVALPARLSQQKAIEKLRGGGARRWLDSMRARSLKRVAAVYVPFSVFRMKSFDGKTQLIAIDSVNGSLDPYSFECEIETESVTTSNFLPPGDPSNIDTAARAAVLRMLMLRYGAFSAQRCSFELERQAHLDFHLPLWVGFYDDKAATVRVLDAVRQTEEGKKAVHFVTQSIEAL